MAAELEWRNWQTHETQNLALRKQHGGSTPPSSRLNRVLIELSGLAFPEKKRSRLGGVGAACELGAPSTAGTEPADAGPSSLSGVCNVGQNYWQEDAIDPH